MGTAPPSQACIRTCAARTPRRCPIAPRTCCVLLRPSVDLSVATFNSPASRPYFSVVSSASDCSVPKQACGGERRGEAYAVQCIERRRVPACSASAAAADAAGSVAAGIHNQQGWQCAAEVTQGPRLCAGTAGAGTGRRSRKRRGRNGRRRRLAAEQCSVRHGVPQHSCLALPGTFKPHGRTL